MTDTKSLSHPCIFGVLHKILTIVPLICLILLVINCAVPVPYWDQWELVPQLEKMYQGDLTFHDLWEQQNEHRIVFPKLIMLLLARLTGWNIRFELATNIILAAGILTVLIWQIRRVGRQLRLDLKWAVPASSLIVFSISQYENWLWGWQLQMLLNVLAVVGGIALLCIKPFRWIRFAAAAFLGTVATYSFANGAAFWAIGLILIAMTAGENRRMIGIAIWLGATCLTMWSYFHHYQRPVDRPPPGLAFELPLEYARYTINYLGGFFVQFPARFNWANRSVAMTFGLGGPCAIAWIGWQLAKRRREEFFAVLPFIAMSAYSVCGALLTGLGRVGMGSNQAFSSRYCTMVVPMWVSLVVLFLIWLKGAENSGEKIGSVGRRITAVALAGLIFFLSLSSAFATLWASKMSQTQAAGLKGLMDLSNPSARMDFDRLAILYPRPEVIIERSRVLAKYNLSVFAEGKH